jgi:8-oxo-dGTP pyrophosphatase MutT (NUDIX family)
MGAAMNFDPAKFFIGLIDFFSIILPGALLTYLLNPDLGPWLLGDARYALLVANDATLAFLFSSYVFGHFVFLIGAWGLDDLYDQVRLATRGSQIKRLSKGEGAAPAWLRQLASVLFKTDVDRTVEQAILIKEHYLDRLGAAKAVNAFQWCKAKLTLDSPAALATVQRFEADSKFFRSFVIVLVLVMPWSIAGTPLRASVLTACVVLLPLALWRYVDQRLKAVNQAYWSVITAEANKADGFRQPAAVPVNSPTGPLPLTHAGGVVYRRRAGAVLEFLLVQASSKADEWVLPKGHIEAGETAACAAVREVLEEAGIWAAVRGPLSSVGYATQTEEVRMAVFLMEFAASGVALDLHRATVWLTPDQARRRATHAQTQRLFDEAAQQLRR